MPVQYMTLIPLLRTFGIPTALQSLLACPRKRMIDSDQGRCTSWARILRTPCRTYSRATMRITTRSSGARTP